MIEERLALDEDGIRAALRSRLLRKYADEADTTVVIDELGLCRGKVRVDVAVVNGLIHGYEIKSDRDSLRRLPVQLEVYGKVLDRATLVVGDRHMTDAASIVPRWWGVLHAAQMPDEVRFRTIREPQRNPCRDPLALVELLWLDDAIALLEQRNVARGMRGKARCLVWNRICESFDIDEIAEAVRHRLKARAAARVHPSPSICGG